MRLKLLILSALGAGILLITSCSKSGGGGSVPPTPTTGPQADNNNFSVAIVEPSVASGLVVAADTVEIRGILTGEVTSLSWQNGASANGDLIVTDQWSVVVPLAVGDNDISVLATGPNGSQTAMVRVIRDPVANLIEQPSLTPDVIFVGEPIELRVTAQIDVAATVNSVDLWQVDNASTPSVMLAVLTDDGDLDNGDEIQGDGIYSAQFTYTGLAVEEIRLRTRVQHTQGTSWTPGNSLLSLDHIDPAAFEASITVQDEARQAYEAALTNGVGAAITAACDVLEASPEVASCGRSGTDGGVWIFYKGGFAGGLLLHDGDLRGGAGVEPPAPVALVEECENALPTEALLLSPFFGTLENADLLTALTGLNCPDWNEQHLLAGQADVAAFKALTGKGVISIASHGDNWYRGDLPVLGQFNLFGWQATLASFGSSVPVIATGEVITSPGPFEQDLLAGRLCIYHRLGSTSAGRLAITPKFISTYLQLPDSIVYVGTCRSAFNGALATAFLDAGASAFAGYDDYVDSNFAATKGRQFWNALIAGQTVGQAFVGSTGPSGATFRLYGDEDATLPDGSLLNGEFECATLGAWVGNGDARLITQLGPLSPPQGQRMAIISTGLGFSTSSGQISQNLCIPPTATSLTFTWDFLSHEFLTFCGSQFQDSFEVVFVPSGGSEQVLFSRTIDQLCGSVTPISVDLGQANDPDGVYHTDWQTTSIDVTALQGTSGQLVLRAQDVGDSIYDTAVLLDEITIQ